MKKRLPDSTRLYHALRAAKRLASRFDSMELSAFLNDEDLQDIVLRQFSIIGEAVNHVTPQTKERHTAVDWQQIVNFRNFVIHEYFRVDLATIWDTATYIVPTLVDQLEVVLADTQQLEANNPGV